MRKLILALVLLATPAHATTSWCGVTVQTYDNFVALRTGPSTAYPEVARLRPGVQLYLADQTSPDGRWFYVEATDPGQFTGWVRDYLVQPVECNY